MRGKDGMNIIFNILSYLLLAGAIVLMVLALLGGDLEDWVIKYYSMGAIACGVLFIIMRILLNIARNMRVAADNTYEILSLVEKYIKNKNGKEEAPSKKELRDQKTIEKFVEKAKAKKQPRTVVAEKPAPTPAPAPVENKAEYHPLSYMEAKPLFRNKIYCAKCGSPMEVFNTNRGIPVAKCPKVSTHECNNPLIRIQQIEKDFVLWYKVSYEKDDYDTFTTKAFVDSVSKVKVNNGAVTFEQLTATKFTPTSGGKKGGIDI